jgi:hypothetical protein
MEPIPLTDEGLDRIEAVAGGRALRLLESLPPQQRRALRAQREASDRG